LSSSLSAFLLSILILLRSCSIYIFSSSCFIIF